MSDLSIRPLSSVHSSSCSEYALIYSGQEIRSVRRNIRVRFSIEQLLCFSRTEHIRSDDHPTFLPHTLEHKRNIDINVIMKRRACPPQSKMESLQHRQVDQLSVLLVV